MVLSLCTIVCMYILAEHIFNGMDNSGGAVGGCVPARYCKAEIYVLTRCNVPMLNLDTLVVCGLYSLDICWSHAVFLACCGPYALCSAAVLCPERCWLCAVFSPNHSAHVWVCALLRDSPQMCSCPICCIFAFGAPLSACLCEVCLCSAYW